MLKIQFAEGQLQNEQQKVLSAGFEAHSAKNNSPEYDQKHVNWSVFNDDDQLVAALTANTLWDWLYIDELWVDETCRGTGLGKQLMAKAEEYAISQNMTGIWLWTQSWQAPGFYRSLGFAEFTRFEDFPKKHSRIGLRKSLDLGV